MASTLLHYVISLKIAGNIIPSSREMFLMGAALGPDASMHEDGSYDKAHFWTYKEDRTKNEIGWNIFAEKYSNLMQDNDFCRGYYCHLIQDALWFRDIVSRNAEGLSGKEGMEIYQKCIRDYGRLNYILTEDYKPEQIDFTEAAEIFKRQPFIDEITYDRLQGGIDKFPGWFKAEACGRDEFELFKLDGIKEYIENAAKACVELLKRI